MEQTRTYTHLSPEERAAVMTQRNLHSSGR